MNAIIGCADAPATGMNPCSRQTDAAATIVAVSCPDSSTHQPEQAAGLIRFLAPGETIVTVKFNVVEHGNPSNPQAPKKYYPSIVASGRVTLRQLVGEISRISTVSSADTMAVLEALLIVIPEELAKGNVVELGDFGNFWLKNRAEGCSTIAEANADQITTLVPRFNPGKEFKKVLQTIEFQKT